MKTEESNPVEQDATQFKSHMSAALVAGAKYCDSIIKKHPLAPNSPILMFISNLLMEMSNEADRFEKKKSNSMSFIAKSIDRILSKGGLSVEAEVLLLASKKCCERKDLPTEQELSELAKSVINIRSLETKDSDSEQTEF